MKNYIMLNGQKVEISDETANNFKKILKPRAEKGDTYYFVDVKAEVGEYFECNDETDRNLFEIGNYFLNEEDAQVAAEKLKEFWKSLK